MFIVRLLRFIMGYVRFRVSGVFVERFLNLASQRGINLWDGRREDTGYVGHILYRDYPDLRPLAKKAGLSMRTEKRFGFPVWRKKYRKRIGLVTGFFLFLILLQLLSAFIWTIQVQGNEDISEETVLSHLDELGLRPGVLRASVTPRELERELMLRINELSWVAVNLVGTTAFIEISERVYQPEMFLDSDTPCNIVADRAGKIVHVETYDGQTDLAKGDTVAKGDLLISGVTETESGKTRFMHAYGKVLAETSHRIEITVALQEKQKTIIGEETNLGGIRFLAWVIPLSFAEKEEHCEVEAKEEPVTLFGLATPFSLIWETQRFYQDETIVLSEKQAKEKAMTLLNERQAGELSSADIQKRELTAQLGKNDYRLTAEYLCIMDIGKEQVIEMERAEKEG